MNDTDAAPGRRLPRPVPPTNVFRRATIAEPLVAARAEGSTVWDSTGRAYLDAAGGAIVVGVGHGRHEIAATIAKQAGRVAYVHGSVFTSEPLEAWATRLAPHLPVTDARIYPVSGGSEAMETALKLARSYHLARGEPQRTALIARRGSYHGNTLGALDVSGRAPLRRPYEPWLGRVTHVSAAYPYRGGEPGADALGDTDLLVNELEATVQSLGDDRVAAFVGEPIVGATLGAAAPPEDYWPRVAALCYRYGILLIADEVMTGFGRTGRWFGLDHWGVTADLVIGAKGVTSGYWPFGLVAASRSVAETITDAGPFVHGFTYSHSPVGAAVAGEVLRILEEERLVEASARMGDRLRRGLQAALEGHPSVGEIRGRGMLIGIELVEDLGNRKPFPRAERVTEKVLAAAREAGVLLYSSTGHADGVDGDLVVLGPPFVLTDAEAEKVVDLTAAAVRDVTRRD